MDAIFGAVAFGAAAFAGTAAAAVVPPPPAPGEVRYLAVLSPSGALLILPVPYATSS